MTLGQQLHTALLRFSTEQNTKETQQPRLRAIGVFAYLSQRSSSTFFSISPLSFSPSQSQSCIDIPKSGTCARVHLCACLKDRDIYCFSKIVTFDCFEKLEKRLHTQSIHQEYLLKLILPHSQSYIEIPKSCTCARICKKPWQLIVSES